MKHFFCLLVAIMFVIGLQYNAFSADSCKIAVINMQKLQEKSKKFQEIRGTLRQKYETLQKKLDNEKNELVKMEEELKKQGMMLSLDAKEDKQKELTKKKRHYKYLAEEFTQEMKQAEIEATNKFGKEIEKVVEKIGKREAYTLILGKRTMGLVYYDNAIDITDEVIKAYDQKK
ncbi:MAG: OmpH family outer membrane protein [Candidatus Aminicenantes bacterium]|nr:MAG: OmpH family outer membrane protein [Candidatus Aminicenantes bacterium]